MPERARESTASRPAQRDHGQYQQPFMVRRTGLHPLTGRVKHLPGMLITLTPAAGPAALAAAGAADGMIWTSLSVRFIGQREGHMFVVVITQPEEPMISPRAIGPFETFDLAQAFSQTLLDKWRAEEESAPQATVVRIEEALPGVVIGEI